VAQRTEELDDGDLLPEDVGRRETKGPSALEPVKTEELGDKDLAEGEALAGGVDPADEPVEGAPPPLRPASTLELDDRDLDAAEPMPAPRVSTPRSRPRPPRGAAALVAPPRHEVEPLAVAPPRRRPRPLTSQTESLSDGLRARRKRRLLTAFWLGAALVAGAAAFRVWTIKEDRVTGLPPTAKHDGGAPLLVHVNVNVIDAQPVDAGMADALDDAAGDNRARSARVGLRRLRDGGALIERDAARPAGARESAERAYQEGLQLLLVSQPSPAIVRFNGALKLDPDFALAYRGLGLAYEKLGRKVLAQAAYERYLIRNPRAPDAELIRKRIDGLR
jgi:hypothetical protein